MTRQDYLELAGYTLYCLFAVLVFWVAISALAVGLR